MVQITKKEFTDILCSKKSYFALIVNDNITEQNIDNLLLEYKARRSEFKNRLRIGKRYSDGIKFSDNSMLTINGKDRTCYKHNNMLLLVISWRDDLGNIRRKIMLYIVD